MSPLADKGVGWDEATAVVRGFRGRMGISLEMGPGPADLGICAFARPSAQGWEFALCSGPSSGRGVFAPDRMKGSGWSLGELLLPSPPGLSEPAGERGRLDEGEGEDGLEDGLPPMVICLSISSAGSRILFFGIWSMQ